MAAISSTSDDARPVPTLGGYGATDLGRGLRIRGFAELALSAGTALGFSHAPVALGVSHAILKQSLRQLDM